MVVFEEGNSSDVSEPQIVETSRFNRESMTYSSAVQEQIAALGMNSAWESRRADILQHLLILNYIYDHSCWITQFTSY
jgi:hypothetical protein